ncbi:MAG: hypothetical protein ACK4VK_03045 [Aquificaceae bacterium]
MESFENLLRMEEALGYTLGEGGHPMMFHIGRRLSKGWMPPFIREISVGGCEVGRSGLKLDFCRFFFGGE